MPNTTTSLGLYKKNPATDGNDTFDIKTMLNDNWDRIDAQVGAQVAASPAPNALNLTSGLQVVNASRTSPYNLQSIQGRTLMNLLGRDGNCEDVSKWTSPSATRSTDSSTFTVGQNSLKIALTAVSGYISKNVSLKNNSYYVLAADLKKGTATNVQANISGTYTTNLVTSTTFSLAYKAFQYTLNNATDTINVVVNGSSGQDAYVDGVRLYEITASEKTYIDGLATSAAQAYIAAKYPYVDDVKHINAPYVMKYGENLLPPFNEWTLHANMTINEPYKATLAATASGQDSYVSLPVVSGQSYTFSATSTAGLVISIFAMNLDGSFGSVLGSGPFSIFTVPSGYSKINVYFGSGGAATYTISNPMLNLGTTAKPFKPRNDDMLAFPSVQLASNSDGTVYDTLFKRDGKYFVEHRLKKDVIADGSLPWSFSSDFTGFKRVMCNNFANNTAGIGANTNIVKNDGTLIKVVASWDSKDLFQLASDGILYLTVSDADSGWGETYTPTAAEIQAYFYGWKMYDTTSGLSSTSTYTRTDGLNKGWAKINGNGVYTNSTSTLPTSSGWTANATPYKLTYQLATPTFEEIQVEGSISLHEGANQIEVGTGIMIREKALPVVYTGNYYWINNTIVGAASYLKNRVYKMLAVYKNGRNDNWLIQDSVGNAYGNQTARTAQPNLFDPTATYEVTYIALDQYALSSSVQAVNGEYASNLKTAVDAVVQNHADNEARISAAEIAARRTYDIQRQIGSVTNPWGDNTRDTRSAVQVRNGSALSISAATVTKVTLDNIAYDNLGELANSRFTAKANGVYDVFTSFNFNPNTTGLIYFQLYKNGVPDVNLSYQTTNASATFVIGSGRILLNAGDYIELYVYTSTASTITANALSRFHITRIA